VRALRRGGVKQAGGPSRLHNADTAIEQIDSKSLFFETDLLNVLTGPYVHISYVTVPVI